MLTSNITPKGTLFKAFQVLTAIIYMEPKFISEDDKFWLILVSKQIDMDNTNPFSKQEIHSSQNPWFK